MEESANSMQPSTGQHGLLQDTEYDCYCMAMTGPVYKLNYFKSSCTLRLEHENCFIGNACEYFKGDEPLRNAYQRGKLNAIHNLKRKPTERNRTCVKCGCDAWIKARNLCSSCYVAVARDGNLDDYPRARKSGATRKAV